MGGGGWGFDGVEEVGRDGGGSGRRRRGCGLAGKCSAEEMDEGWRERRRKMLGRTSTAEPSWAN
jgi:hypothetical protein